MTPEQRAERLRYHEYDSLEGIEEHAERIVKLEELSTDAICVVIGWAWKLNELMGYDKEDITTYPMQVADGLVKRLHELGVEVTE